MKHPGSVIELGAFRGNLGPANLYFFPKNAIFSQKLLTVELRLKTFLRDEVAGCL